MPLEVSDRDEWFPISDAIPRPDWPAINAWMRDSVTPEYVDEASGQITRHWLSRLAAALGKSYAITTSEHFFLVSADDEKSRLQTLDFLEKAHAYVMHGLGDPARKVDQRQQAFVRLASADEFYAVATSIDSDGAFADAVSAFFPQGSVPFSYIGSTLFSEGPALARAVADHLLTSLPLPAWVHHATAVLFAVDLAGGRSFPLLHDELVTEHYARWNAETIQDFWSGKSFSNEVCQGLSQSLAEVLTDVILREVRPDPETLRRFLCQANKRDAGEAAALNNLEVGLGEIASVFLGDGDWSPKPAIWKTNEEQA